MKPWTDDNGPNRPILLIIAVLVILGLFVRVWGLRAYTWSPDEAVVLLISSQPTIADILDAASHHPHPPLRYLMLHVMLQLSEGFLFLKSIGYIPGVALIPMFFLLGRRISGNASGVTMATLSAFSYAAVLLSQVLRAYMLGTLFVASGLYAFFSYLRDRRVRYLYLYGVSTTLGLLSHYFTIVPVAAMVIVWLYHVVRSPRPKELLRVVLANLPVAAVALASYVVHISSRFGEAGWSSIADGWLAPLFPTSVLGFLSAAKGLFAYLYLTPNAGWAMVLAVLGLVALWWEKNRDVAVVIILTGMLNIGLAAAHAYPFGGTRQCVYLLPMISIAMGAAVQRVWTITATRVEHRANSGLLKWVRSHSNTISKVALTFYVASMVFLAFEIVRTQSFRRYDLHAWAELPVRAGDVTRALRFIQDRADEDDVLLAEKQTIFYIRLETGQPPTPVSNNVSRCSFEGREFFFVEGDWTFESQDSLWSAFTKLLDAVETGGHSRIWVVSIGWQPIRGVVSLGAFRNLVVDRYDPEGAGASVYEFDAESIVEEIEKRIGREGDEPSSAPSSKASGLTCRW